MRDCAIERLKSSPPRPPEGGGTEALRGRSRNAPRPAAGGGGHGIGGGAGGIHLDWIMETLGDFYADPEEPGAALDPDLARARAEAAGRAAAGLAGRGGGGGAAERLFRRRHTGRVMFNSGNLNLRRGAGTAMEERDRPALENRRLGERLREGRLEDPEVEKVVRVEGGGGAAAGDRGGPELRGGGADGS